MHCPCHPSCYIEIFAPVLVTGGCLIHSNLSFFTRQAVVELLSPCGLPVVSGLLTLEWWVVFCFVFLPFSSCFKPTYTHRHKHLNTSTDMDMSLYTSRMGCEEIRFHALAAHFSLACQMTVKKIKRLAGPEKTFSGHHWCRGLVLVCPMASAPVLLLEPLPCPSTASQSF